jgi:hypothetical protein
MQGYDSRAWAFAIANDSEMDALVGAGGGVRRAAPSLGIRALMLAILEDAIRAYLGPLTGSQREASFWIADGRQRWVFSFPVVCETLGLEPDAVRGALRRMHARSATALQPPRLVGRSRPNVRRRDGCGGRKAGVSR